jgi:Protein of unknown function (DUF3604)
MKKTNHKKMNNLYGLLLAVVAITVLILPGVALAQEFTVEEQDAMSKKAAYSPFVDQHYPTQVFWGDTHLHTANSIDAGFTGTKLGPEEAYRFARGEEMTASNGMRAKLVRPLDFLVVADHAEYFGLTGQLRSGDPALLADPVGKRWYDMFNGSEDGGYKVFMEVVRSATVANPKELVQNPAAKRSVWESVNAIAEKYNDPGRFTALIGFEWSSTPLGGNLHRVVIFRDGAGRANQVVPLAFYENPDPEHLWKWMESYEKKTGGRILALAHNGNWSNGLMFKLETLDGRPFDRAYAETRMRWEPIYEVTQMKGDGETHPFLSAEDEFADFEPWDKADVPARNPKKPEMLQYEYAREALKNGLALEARLGLNPFKFGMVGSTDSHTALATAREDNYFGKMAKVLPSDHRAEAPVIKSPTDPKLSSLGGETGAAGLAAVWARENTRKAIFDAMTRKEVYATTGSRIAVRVFAGWDFQANEVERQDFAKQGYARGVPMGGDLSAAPRGKTPSFMVRALRDPDNANLDRIQVIKGWVDKKGKTRERIYDVAVSDGRKIGRDGRCKTPVGSTVDITDASYTNTIGDPLLTAHWVDPDFDPKQRAVYYVRVIEIPKPRWTAHDAKFFKIKMPEGTRMIVQDRAYTSPIWYTP